MDAEKSNYEFEALQTPCFILDEPKLINNIHLFSMAIRERFENGILAYSVKTNSLPYILNIAMQQGCYVEVVSHDEYCLVKKIGFETKHIVYNGPLKEKESFLEALDEGAYVNIETAREIDWLEEYKGNKDINIGIRANIDLGYLSPDDAEAGEEESRFGFAYENGNLRAAIDRITAMGYQVSGLYAHRTSRTRSLEVYKAICQYTNRIIKEIGLNLNYVDVGGGFYGDFQGKPNYREYMECIHTYLDIPGDCTVIVKPGNGLIASPMEYVLSVIDTKEIGNKTIVTTNGTRLDIDPFFHKSSYDYKIISKSDTKMQKQVLTGCTCLENDKLMEMIDEVKLTEGDRIVFKNVGAYTMALTPNFIRFLPRVYRFDGERYVPVRDSWNADNFIAGSRMDSFSEADGYLFTNAGRRAKLLLDFKESLGYSAKIVATDNWSVAPALYAADKYYLTGKIDADNYIDELIEICKKERIKVITSLIDPEIAILSKNREKFLNIGVLPLCPDIQTSDLCFDKYKMYEYLKHCGIRTVLTYPDVKSFDEGYNKGEIDFPVFIKPRTGSGSVGAEKINTYSELTERFDCGKYDYIIQEYMDCEDCDADVYVDTISHQAVSALLKKKIETRVGGASKTIAFKDESLYEFIKEITSLFEFNGAVDMDFFYKDGKYYLSEINPRFGGAYLHAFGAGLDFPKLIRNNIQGKENKVDFGNYDEGSIMLMYDDVFMVQENNLLKDYND